MWNKGHSVSLIRMWVKGSFSQTECGSRACHSLLCLGSRRGGKETRARSLHAPTAGFNSPPARQVNLCRHQYVNLARFIFFWLNRHLGHVQPGLSLYNAFILQALAGGREDGGRRGERGGWLKEEVVVVVDSSPLFPSLSSPSSFLPCQNSGMKFHTCL